MSRDVKRPRGFAPLGGALRRYFNPVRKNPFLRYEPGHFYSPLPCLAFVNEHRARLFDRRTAAIPGIDNHTDEQLALVDEFSRFYAEVPFQMRKTNGLRYYFQNEYFGFADAVILYSMLRYYQPRRVIEVGSGFSSAVMLDTNERYLSASVRLTFIDPFPERLKALITKEDEVRNRIIAAPVQDVSLDVFRDLEANDMLIIDSSHIAKIGSDVVHLLTEVLPVLAKGVIIHFHDVFWPFEYPEEWIRQGRAWNEAYVLKAFLQFNTTFRILLHNSFLFIHYPERLERRLPLFMQDGGASLWITKIG